MFESERSGAGMIKDDVGYAGHLAMARNGNKRHLKSFGKRRINSDQPFHGSLLQDVRIFLDEIVAMAMAHDEIEVAFLEKMVFDAGHYQSRIPFADFRNDHADGITALLAKGPCQVVGT